MDVLLFRNRPKENFRVRVGDLDNSDPDEHEQEFEVDEIIIHPRYSIRKSPHLDLDLPKFYHYSKIYSVN